MPPLRAAADASRRRDEAQRIYVEAQVERGEADTRRHRARTATVEREVVLHRVGGGEPALHDCLIGGRISRSGRSPHAPEAAQVDRKHHRRYAAEVRIGHHARAELRQSREFDALRRAGHDARHRYRGGRGRGRRGRRGGGRCRRARAHRRGLCVRGSAPPGSRHRQDKRDGAGEKRSAHVHVSLLIFYLSAVGSMSVGARNCTPCGNGIGVGSGRTNGAPLSSISQRSSIALSSCTVLWQCSMNMPPQSRNCSVRVTDPPGRSRQTSLRPFSQAGTFAALPLRASVWHSSKWMWIGGSQPPPPFFSVQISRLPEWGAAETRPKSAANIWLSFTLMPQGPKNVLTGSLVFWPAPRPNSKVRVLATGIFERSGLRISVLGTWL